MQTLDLNEFRFAFVSEIWLNKIGFLKLISTF